MKKITILSVMAMLLLAVGVSATLDPTGFAFNKNVVVKGDWKWEHLTSGGYSETGSSGVQYYGKWNKGVFPTATYDYSVFSELATVSSVDNYDKLGLAWKYIGETTVTVNAPAQYVNNLNAWTVNDPATTPATGGYTKFNYFEQTKITDINAKSKVTMWASGYGKVDISSVVETDAESTQVVQVLINQPTQ